MMVIKPYWWEGTWVFDDPAVGLTREPFVAGVPEMINLLVKEIPGARQGFRLLFSAKPFPGCQAEFLRDRPGEFEGAWYRTAPPWPPMEGWLCPALFKYFDEAPPVIYVKAEALSA
jgi:hypothetical protein